MEILAEQWKRDNYLTDKYKEVKEKLKNYIKSNELVEAGKLIEQYHKILFLDIEYIYWLGMYYHRMGKNEKAIEILRENYDKLHELAAYLIEKETITGEEFMRILNA